MNRQQLIEQLTRRTDALEFATQDFLKAFEEIVTETLKEGEEVWLPGFGKFFIREREARDVKNPQTGEQMHVPAGKIAAFRPGKDLKDAI